jgi:hypothetical protein
MRNVYKIFVGKSKGKKQLGGPRHRCVKVKKAKVVPVFL